MHTGFEYEFVCMRTSFAHHSIIMFDCTELRSKKLIIGALTQMLISAQVTINSTYTWLKNNNLCARL